MGVNEGSGMQFDQVEMPGPAAPPACARCNLPLDEYFALGGQMFCRACTGGLRNAGSFWRALLFGAGAAALGSLVWFGVYKASKGSSFGLIAIVVGLFVGIAVRKGARGLGGWKYQTLAMVLTYLAITTSYVPVILEQADAVDQQDDDQMADAHPAGGVPAASDTRAKTPLRFGLIVIVFALATTVPFNGGVGLMAGSSSASRCTKRGRSTGAFRSRARSVSAAACPCPRPRPSYPRCRRRPSARERRSTRRARRGAHLRRVPR